MVAGDGSHGSSASEAKAAERPRKIPKLELLAVDEYPEGELSATQLSKAAMMEILDLRNTAVALCQGAHLHSLKEFSRRFLKAAYEKYPEGSGLRAPSLQEIMKADQRLWGTVAQLMNEEGFSMNAALHEVGVVRNDISCLLMPRPFIPKAPQLPWRPKGKGATTDKGKGKAGKAGKGLQPGKGASFQVNSLQLASFYKKGQEKKFLCRDFQRGACRRADCAFEHKCGVWLPDGSICLLDHSAMQHKKTPH